MRTSFTLALAVTALAGSIVEGQTPQRRSAATPPAASMAAPPAAPTFYKDVEPILSAHCQGCHQPAARNLGGLVAPMPLVTYEDVRPRAKAIVRATHAKQMPPWLAGPRTAGVFANERGLTSAQIATLAAWDRAGAPAGPPTSKPVATPAPEAASSWTLGEPDIDVVAETTELADDAAENMVTYEVGSLPRDLWVQGIEFRAGSTAVHHICGAAVLPIGRFVPGFDRETSLGCSAPGSAPRRLPDGYAYRLPRGAAIRLDIHYFKRPGPGTRVTDTSHLGLTYPKTPVTHRVRFNAVGHTTFEVPPGHPDWRVGAARVFPEATTILSLWPHGHARAVSATYKAAYPDGTSEVLLDVPRYDYAWQETYEYRTPKVIPAGTRVEVLYRYDNSPARAGRQHFDSSQPVRFGARAEDEMMLGYINYVEVGGISDAVDTDRLLRGTTTLPGHDDVSIEFPKLPTDAADVARVDALSVGSVWSFVGSSAMKLRTGVGLKVGTLPVPTGNAVAGYAGLYGLWLRKVAAGWRLVLTNQPDVWGTQFDAASIVGEVPLRYERTSNAADAFTARLEDAAGTGRLTLTWGPHQWTTTVALAASRP